MAHTLPYELEQLEDSAVCSQYIAVGFEHIIPSGLDHILFIACVFFLNKSLKQVVLQASMFTVAHSITLALAMYGIIHPISSIVEPIIAFSIFVLAIENIFIDRVRSWRLAMVFGFGLIHGLGFANALSELSLPSYAFANALISFNVGVELGQLCIIVLLYGGIAYWLAQKEWYKSRVIVPINAGIAIVALYWTVERCFFV